ncbi:OmpA family domain protein [Sulfitobacter noctilucicola]|uniref:OOP family OmpA-OmpF porin n=1 Tax=Sulfitobacter noctilucicola TaxID=1342301 RepID=A0A7W6M5T3_9RHOB|nr:OmpA family protein [Sulfitobacter noctilucicola]KIN62501.1 OmpA family domain protein [Sulfitobacter noctilucicola]MBB4172969.1 OOP family OmpA-OmpF porin [Sulfitobacter noctilucicola]
MKIAWLVIACVLASPAAALDLTLPSTARQTVTRDTSPDVYEAPVGVFENGQVPTIKIEGDVRRAAWKLNSPGLTPFQVMRPLRSQLIEAGFEIALDCRATACGGFDFRFATETLPGPNMYVNIRAFQFVTGIKTSESEVSQVVTLLASTSAASAFVQIIQAGEVGSEEPQVDATGALPTAPLGEDGGDFVTRLLARGHTVLTDLDFETGKSALGSGPFRSLEMLSEYLQANPQMRIAVVGHTDATGALDTNITISRSRARSVRQRLINAYKIDPARLDAEGMGYLAPVASNLDPAGREANRRVEIVLLGSS